MTLPITPRTPFGARIRDERERAGMTQEELGEALGFPAAYVSQLESGRRGPSESTILGISAAFYLDPDELYALAGKAPPDIIDRIAGNLPIIRRVRRLLNGETKTSNDSTP